MPRGRPRKLVENTEMETVSVEEKFSNDAVVRVTIDVNGREATYDLIVKEFCCQVVKPKQTPETVLEALVSGLEAHFGKKLSIH